MRKLVHNERTKLLATFFNNLGVASVVAGFIVPTFNFALVDIAQKAFIASSGIGCVFYIFAYLVMGRLRD